MEEQPLDLKSTFKAIAGHRLLVLALVLLGLSAGIAYVVTTPPVPGARSLVLLPPSAITGNPGPSPYTQTQEIIVTSTPVLSPAGSVVSPPISAVTLRGDVTVTAPSQDVLQIAVQASTLGKAERLANAVATNYVVYMAGTANSSEQLLTQLQDQAAQLTNQVLAEQKQIDAAQARLAVEPPTSPAGERDTNLFNSLRTEQGQLSVELENVNTQIVNAEVTTAQATSATRVLERAEPVKNSDDRVPVVVALGALAGLVAGCVAAFALAGSDRRLRSRAAIAAAIGLPVIASMWARRCKKVNDWRRLLEHSKSPSPVEVWNARRVLYRLIGAAGEAVVVDVRLLAFSGDDAATAAAAKIAGSAAALGMSSRLEIGSHPGLAGLRAACVVTRGREPGTAIVDLKADTAASTELAGLAVNVTLEAIDAERPQVGASPATTLLVVSSGFAIPADLARAALAASDSGSPITGVVVANPDPDDNSTGLLPDTHERGPARSRRSSQRAAVDWATTGRVGPEHETEAPRHLGAQVTPELARRELK
jgi:capsular polysaccharide biosynthesis protein